MEIRALDESLEDEQFDEKAKHVEDQVSPIVIPSCFYSAL